MRIADLGVDDRLVDRFRELGYDELWPPQAEAAPHAVAGRNLVLAVPTASGKSLVAYLALLNRALQGDKALYLVPLRALAREKHEELQELAEALDLRVALAVGDLDSSDPYLRDFDVIVATSEKADALMRHRAHWLQRLGVVVADEVHLIHDGGRGPTLEVTLSRFRQLNPDAQIIALSATIKNSGDLAAWLEAEHVQSTWRPVTLREGVLFGRAIRYTDNATEEVRSDLDASDGVPLLVDDTLHDDGQALVFVNTRRSTEAAAERLRHVVSGHLRDGERARLTDLANRLRGGPDSTDVESRLAQCVQAGSAFHHAGLTNRERNLVEEAFKSGDLKVIVATPTLAAGINLPARRVIVRDLWRYDVNEGNVPLPVMEYKQMAGRAGRPKYDAVGEALVIAKDQEKRDELLLDYLLADPERIDSKLGSEPALRHHILASIASGYVEDEAGLRAFIGSTFFAHLAEMWTIEDRLTHVLDFLLEEGMVVSEGDTLRATAFGHRVSELYIDPVSAVTLRRALEAAAPRLQEEPVVKVEGAEAPPEPTDLSYLHAVCATPDMRTLYLRKSDGWVEREADERAEEFLLPVPTGTDYEFFLTEVKTALLIQAWIDERSEEKIVQRFNVYPGDIHNRVETARWLLYACGEIARLFDVPAVKPLRRLTQRVRYGAREELMPLLELRGVGRFRARALFQRGLRTQDALRRVPVSTLSDVPGIGPTIARRIKEQLGEPVETAGSSGGDGEPVPGQLSLAHFRAGAGEEDDEDADDDVAAGAGNADGDDDAEDPQATDVDLPEEAR